MQLEAAWENTYSKPSTSSTLAYQAYLLSEKCKVNSYSEQKSAQASNPLLFSDHSLYFGPLSLGSLFNAIYLIIKMCIHSV